MKLKEIIDFLDEKIPPSLALDFDDVGFKKDYDLTQDISSIKIFMDLFPEYDNYKKDTLIITHHPPLFIPKTPTYTIHSNWDIADGGANESLAKQLKLDVVGSFDLKTGIGRICTSNYTFRQLKDIILDNFKNSRIVNAPEDDEKLEKIGIISGFGLKNTEYIQLAYDNELDMLISGDLTQETAILAKNLGLSLIDLGHHESEVSGLYQMKNILDELDLDVEVIDIEPIQKL